MKCRFRHLGFVLVLVLLLSANLSATSIEIIAGPTLSASYPDALAAINRAASAWGSLFSDPITVSIYADFANFGNPLFLGMSGTTFWDENPSTEVNMIRDKMIADAVDEPSNGIVAYLPDAAQFSAVYEPGGWSFNGTVSAAQANLKALGFSGFSGYDSILTFNTAFLNFDFDNLNGVSLSNYDFETVAAHEIGHALGFESSLDRIDWQIANGDSPSSMPITPLDMFRFPSDALPQNESEFTTFSRSLSIGANSSFYDLNNQWAFSEGGLYTGRSRRRQASHWIDNIYNGNVQIGMMDPSLSRGQIWRISDADIRALDLIGWDVAVPEPASLVLLGTGLLGLVVAVHRNDRRRQ